MPRKSGYLLGVGVIAAALTASVLAEARPAGSAADSKVSALIRMMDKDRNGIVSKAEFMGFMSAEFDRIDASRNGGLSAEEFSRSVLARRNGRAELNTVKALIRLMDRNGTGEVEKDEFLAFVSEEFDRLDVDRSGTLTHQELSRSVFIRGQQKQPGGTHK